MNTLNNSIIEETGIKKICQQDIDHVEFNIVQANTLILANQNLTLNEHKIILATIAQISQYDTELMTYEFTPKQIAEICHFDKRHIGRILNEVNRNLFNRTLSYEKEIERNGQKEKVLVKCHWIERLAYNQNRWIIKLSNDLKPFLIALKKEFTSEKLNNIVQYNNYYAIRLDLIFTMEFNRQTSKMSSEKTKKHQMRFYISLDKLREKFCFDTKYQNPSDFVRYIIVPAINEINDLGYYKVNIEKDVGAKNKIIGFTFLVGLGDENNRLKEEITVSNRIEQTLLNTGFSKSETKKILKNHEEQELFNILSQVAKMEKENAFFDIKEEIKNRVLELESKKKIKESLQFFLN